MKFSTRPDKVKELIQLIMDDKKAQDLTKTIHFQDTFLFTYNVWISVDVNSNFLDQKHNIDDFK